MNDTIKTVVEWIALVVGYGLLSCIPIMFLISLWNRIDDFLTKKREYSRLFLCSFLIDSMTRVFTDFPVVMRLGEIFQEERETPDHRRDYEELKNALSMSVRPIIDGVGFAVVRLSEKEYVIVINFYEVDGESIGEKSSHWLHERYTSYGSAELEGIKELKRILGMRMNAYANG